MSASNDLPGAREIRRTPESAIAAIARQVIGVCWRGGAH